MFGANVAERELICATLKCNQEISWDMWDTALASSLADHAECVPVPPALEQLHSKYRDRLATQRLSSLSAIARATDYTFVCSTPAFSGISEIRAQTHISSMPICNLVHSVWTRDIFATYTSLLMCAEAHDVVVASSRSAQTALERLFESSLDRIRMRFGKTERALTVPEIVHIPFGVDVPPDEALNTTQARSLLQIPEGRFAVLYLGRISEEYKADLDPLLQAVRQLVLSGHDACLILAGQACEPSYNHYLRNRVNLLGLADRTINLDNFPEFLKTSIYAAADVFVSPSDSIQETFGLTILEAMAHGKPAIVSSWSGYRDLVLDGQTGFLLRTKWQPEAADYVSLHAQTSHPRTVAHYLAQHSLIDAGELLDKLVCLAGNRELRKSMGDAARKRALESFGWPGIVNSFVDLWREQVKRGKKISRNFGHRAGLGDIFAHYADDAVSPHDLVCSIPGFDLENIRMKDWQFHDADAFEQVRRVMGITGNQPTSIGELRENGLSLECILWPVKKGLRRIVRVADV